MTSLAIPDWVRLDALPTPDRGDGWRNVLTGIGGSKDKRTRGEFHTAPRLSWKELQELFAGDDLARRIVMKPAGDMVREWFAMNDPDLDDAIQGEFKRLGVKKKLKKGVALGKLYGGAIAILGVNDSRTMDQPLEDERQITEIEWIHILHRHQVRIIEYDVTGEPLFYEVLPSHSTQRRGLGFGRLVVHADRTLHFGGVLTDDDRKEYNDGWDDSIFIAIYDTLRDFEQTWAGVSNVLQDFAQAVYTLKGLGQMVASNEDQLIKRFAIIDAARSVLNAIAIDKDETFTRDTTPLTGVADVLDRFEYRMSVAAEMPVSVLFGRAPAGMNSTGEHDLTVYYDQVKARQRDELDHHVERLIDLSIRSSRAGISAPAEYAHQWHPLKQQSQKEIVESREKQARIDDMYIGNSVLSPDEVRESRFGGNEYSIETNLDPTIDMQALREEQQMMAAAIAGQPGDDPKDPEEDEQEDGE